MRLSSSIPKMTLYSQTAALVIPRTLGMSLSLTSFSTRAKRKLLCGTKSYTPHASPLKTLDHASKQNTRNGNITS